MKSFKGQIVVHLLLYLSLSAVMIPLPSSGPIWAIWLKFMGPEICFDLRNSELETIYTTTQCVLIKWVSTNYCYSNVLDIHFVGNMVKGRDTFGHEWVNIWL